MLLIRVRFPVACSLKTAVARRQRIEADKLRKQIAALKKANAAGSTTTTARPYSPPKTSPGAATTTTTASSVDAAMDAAYHKLVEDTNKRCPLTTLSEGHQLLVFCEF